MQGSAHGYPTHNPLGIWLLFQRAGNFRPTHFYPLPKISHCAFNEWELMRLLIIKFDIECDLNDPTIFYCSSEEALKILAKRHEFFAALMLAARRPQQQRRPLPESFGTPFAMVPYPDLDNISIESSVMTRGTVKKQNMSPWRARLYHFMYKKDSLNAKITYYFIIAAIFVSTIAMIISTVPAYQSGTPRLILFWLDASCIMIFTVELILNIIAAPSPKHLVSVWFGIDLLAILPFYIELIFDAANKAFIIESDTAALGAVRALRLFRIFILLKTFRKSSRLRIVIKAFKDAWEVCIGFILGIPHFAICFIRFGRFLRYTAILCRTNRICLCQWCLDLF